MQDTADHTYNPKSASLALKTAIADLAKNSGKLEGELVGMRMGDLFDLAIGTYGAQMPDFWRVWNSWNQADDTPAEWGDL